MRLENKLTEIDVAKCINPYLTVPEVATIGKPSIKERIGFRLQMLANLYLFLRSFVAVPKEDHDEELTKMEQEYKKIRSRIQGNS